MSRNGGTAASRMSRSEPDLLKAVRRAASDISRCSNSRAGYSAASGRNRGTSSHSRLSGSTSSSSWSRLPAQTVMTVQEQQGHVLKAAQDRFLAAMQSEAKDSSQSAAHLETKIKDGLVQERVESQRRREMNEHNQRSVREQIESNKGRNVNTRKDFIAAASAHEFPLFTETFISEKEVIEYRKKVKTDWRAELQVQQQTQQMMNNIVVKRDREVADAALQKSIRTLRDERQCEDTRKRGVGSYLRSSWDNEIKLNELKKDIRKGKDVSKEIESMPQVQGYSPDLIRKAN